MTDANEISIVVCGDQNAVIGLHCVLRSLVLSQKSRLKVHFIHEGVSSYDLRKLTETLTSECTEHSFIPIEFGDDATDKLPKLFGSRMTYARLFLGSLLQSEQRVIYLDYDVLVDIDLLPLWRMDLTSNIIAASGIATVKWANDHAELCTLGLNLDDRYFNGGVLVIDLESWRRERYEEQVRELIETKDHLLKQHDQTVLNFLLSRRFLELPAHYNVSAGPTKIVARNSNSRILHFVGAPKPWDPGGKWIHGSYDIFHQVLRQTSIYPLSRWRRLSIARWLRAARLARSYKSAVVHKLRANARHP